MMIFFLKEEEIVQKIIKNKMNREHKFSIFFDKKSFILYKINY